MFLYLDYYHYSSFIYYSILGNSNIIFIFHIYRPFTGFASIINIFCTTRTFGSGLDESNIIPFINNSIDDKKIYNDKLQQLNRLQMKYEWNIWIFADK